MKRNDSLHATASVAARAAFNAMASALPTPEPGSAMPESILAHLMLRRMCDEVLTETAKMAFEAGCREHPMPTDPQ